MQDPDRVISFRPEAPDKALRPGDIVVFKIPRSGYHTGIYIGDGKVMDSISSGIRTSSLTDWIAENGRGWVVYGWPW